MTPRKRYPWNPQALTQEMQNTIADQSERRLLGQWPLAGRSSGPLETVANEQRFKKQWFHVATSGEIAQYIGSFRDELNIDKTTDCRTGDEIDESDYSIWCFPRRLDTCKQNYVIYYDRPTRVFFPGLDRMPCFFCPEVVCAFLNYSSNRWEAEHKGFRPLSAPASAISLVAAYDGSNCFPCGQFQILERVHTNCDPGAMCFQQATHPCTGANWVEEICNLSPREIPANDIVLATTDECCQWWIKDCCEPFV